MTHKMIKCSCGVVLSECRCPSPNKVVETSPDPCPHKDTTGAVESEVSLINLLAPFKNDSVNRISGWEQGGMVLVPTEDGGYTEYVPVRLLETFLDAAPSRELEVLVEFVRAAMNQSTIQILYPYHNLT